MAAPPKTAIELAKTTRGFEPSARAASSRCRWPVEIDPHGEVEILLAAAADHRGQMEDADIRPVDQPIATVG